ncbi:hypothetical protein HPP92_014436 [Vanilla planifolia]|uniref:Uncharacterized protein n=1 Tax=Vanilla planifolia TaxID=51239 RepID=A0A835QQY7_VANPL|nr:hypothetical protein HPP92_014436 [Vanilla planifolia]
MRHSESCWKREREERDAGGVRKHEKLLILSATMQAWKFCSSWGKRKNDKASNKEKEKEQRLQLGRKKPGNKGLKMIEGGLHQEELAES